MERVLTIHDVYGLSLRSIDLIINERCIYELLLYKIIHPNDLQGMNTKGFYATVFSERIFALLLDRPYTLMDVEDTLSIIKNEITSACVLNDIHYFVLYEWICKALLEKIMIYCSEHSIKSLQDTIKNTFNKVCCIITDRYKTNELATKTLDKVSKFLSYFELTIPVNNTDVTLQALSNLSKRLAALDQLLRDKLEVEQLNTPRLR